MNLMKGSFKTRAQVKLWAHIVALFLVTSVTAIAGARMLVMNRQMSPPPTSVTGNGGRRSMSGRIALSMGAKSLIFITYQLIAEHTRFLKERPRVNMILNCVETIAWPAVVAFTVQGILKRCMVTTCVLSWVLIPLAVVLSLVSTLAAYISVGDWMYFKKTGVRPGEGVDNGAVNLEPVPKYSSRGASEEDDYQREHQ